jgi:hypothetical protein
MEPRQHKKLAEIMFVIGGILAVVGLVLYFALDIKTAGAVLLIIGSAMILIALPTFMLLMMYTTALQKK